MHFKENCKDSMQRHFGPEHMKMSRRDLLSFSGDQEHIVCNFCFPPSLPSMKSNQSLSFLCELPTDLQAENIVYELSTVLLYPIHVVSRHTEKLFFSCFFSSALFKLQFCLKLFQKMQLL